VKKLIRADLQPGLANIAVFALLLVMVSGCFWQKKTKSSPAFAVQSSGSQTNVVMTPARSATGRISSVNQPGKFAVVNFPVGQVPPNDTRLSIFRAGTKVGEMRVSGPAADTFTVGDITSGEAAEGDEVRAE